MILVDGHVTVGYVLSLRINMYSEGIFDLMEMIMMLPFKADAKLEPIKSKAKDRYLPVFEKVPPCLLYILYEMVWSNN